MAMTNANIESHYWGYEIVKEQLEGGFLDQWQNRQGMPSVLIIKDTTDHDQQIPASEFGKEAGLIMIPSWAARPNVGFEMGLTALCRLMTHETIWSHAVQLTQENLLDKQILNAVEELKKYMSVIPKTVIIYVARPLSMAITISELKEMREAIGSWCESVHLDIHNIEENDPHRKVYIWCA